MPTRRQIERIHPNATALRALAHEQRLRMLGLLRVEGPATATRLAQRLGLNSGATSYHLRQLAQHGFIEEDKGRGTGRERWWRACHETTGFENSSSDGIADAFAEAALNGQIRQMQLAMRQKPALPQEWRNATSNNDIVIPLSASEAEALTGKLLDLLWEAMARAPKLASEVPETARPVSFILNVFPFPDEGAEDR